MGETYERLSAEEIQTRVQMAVETMEEGINEINGTPNLVDSQRHNFFEMQCMLFLEEEYGVTTSRH